MDFEYLFVALGIISVITSLGVEGVKKILDEKQVKYSSNILAVIVSVVITVAASICYVIYMNISITPQVIVEIIVLAFLSFLMATVGYDKITQMISQLKVIK